MRQLEAILLPGPAVAVLLLLLCLSALTVIPDRAYASRETAFAFGSMPSSEAAAMNGDGVSRRILPSAWLRTCAPAYQRLFMASDTADSSENESVDVLESSLSVWDRTKLYEYARSRQGVQLSLSTLGPGFRAVARSTQNSSEILGYVEGFVRPSGSILHLDKMEVFAKVVKRVREENDDFSGGGTPLGVGLLMGYDCLLHAIETSESLLTAEFLAIDDQEYQHKRLVRLYRLAGFDVVKYVGDDWRDVSDRLVWGGCGTLLRKDVPTLLRMWTLMFEKNERRKTTR